MLDPNEISLPASLPAPRQTSWSELFKYPRSIAASCLTGLSQTGGVGLALWQVTLLVLVLKVTPAQQQRLIGRILDQRMAEHICVRRRAARRHDLRGNQRRQFR